jgi:hypothetical protein
MNIQRLFLALILSFIVSAASAQIYVTVRPSRPVYVRTVAPSPRHIWIEEDWNGRDGRYEWSGGHWAEAPQPGYRYRQGYWRHSTRGDHWTPGRWQGGNKYNNGNHKGHNNGKHKGHHKNR